MKAVLNSGFNILSWQHQSQLTVAKLTTQLTQNAKCISTFHQNKCSPVWWHKHKALYWFRTRACSRINLKSKVASKYFIASILQSKNLTLNISSWQWITCWSHGKWQNSHKQRKYAAPGKIHQFLIEPSWVSSKSKEMRT